MRLATFGGLGDLDTLTVDSDGTVTVVVVREVRSDGLPDAVTKFFPASGGSCSAIGDCRLRGEVSIVPGQLVEAHDSCG